MVHLVEMVRNTVRVLESERLHRRLIDGALRTRIYDWREIGAKWERMLERVWK